MKKKKMSAPRHPKVKELAAEFQKGFSLMGIQNLPTYTDPHAFARRFEKCSVLIENHLSTGAGTAPSSLLRKD